MDYARSRACLVLLGALACGDDATPVSDAGTSGGATSTTGTSVVDVTSSSGTSGSESSTSSSSSSEEEGSSTSGEAPPPPLSWIEDCVVQGSDLGSLYAGLECTAIDVPLDWGDPEGEQIQIAALRVRTQAERRGQYWMLAGGPGGSGLSFLFDSDAMTDILGAGWDVVIPNHRGTLAPSLNCVFSPETSAECRAELDDAWGDGLQHFNTVQAAYDVGELVARSQVDNGDESTIVYGVSYGTYWGLFYAGLHSGQADGVVLDSVLPADVDVVAQEAVIQARLEALLQQCVDDPVCGPNVGFASGAAFADALVTAFDENDCGGGDLGTWAESPSFRDRFGFLLNSTGLRNFIPLLVALLQRCTAEDTALVNDAISDLLNAGFSGAGSAYPYAPTPGHPIALPPDPVHGVDPSLFGSGEVFNVVANTTLVAAGADFEAATQEAANNVAVGGILAAITATQEVWGDLPKVDFDTGFTTETPLLILNARYDIQTPLTWAESAGERYGDMVYIVEDARHSVASTGSGGDGLDSSSPCVRPIILEFAADPTTAPDSACLADLPGIDVNLQASHLQDLTMTVFGIPDPWTLITG